jgi:hypothetical protein
MKKNLWLVKLQTLWNGSEETKESVSLQGKKFGKTST